MGTTVTRKRRVERKVAKSDGARAPGQKAIRVALEPGDTTFTFYANVVEIGSQRHEFTILAARVPTKPSRSVLESATASGEMVLEPEVQVLVAPTLVPGIIKALQAQLVKFEEHFGPLKEQGGDDD